MAYPRFQLARNFKHTRVESGNITLNGTSFVVVAGTALTLPAQVGDCIEYGVSLRLGAEAVVVVLDAATIVSSAITNRFGSTDPTAIGSPGWYSPGGVLHGVAGAAMLYAVQSGDIVSGAVTVQLIAKTGTAANRTLYAATTVPLGVYAKNLGPVDPN